MNNVIRENTLRGLTVQRNVFVTVIFILLIANCILGILVFSKTERVVIIPAVVEKAFWVEGGGGVSASYLEQMGSFVGDLLLTRSPSSADMQLNILMRQTAPSFAPLLSSRLESELIKLKKDKASYVFFKTKMTVDPQKLNVFLEGDRVLFLGDKVLSTIHEGYQLTFLNFGGRLLLTSIERGENEG